MAILDQIENYIQSQTEAKQRDMSALHNIICGIAPKAKVVVLDGKDENGKVVSNPNIGYGLLDLKYADGSSRPFTRWASVPTVPVFLFIYNGLKDKNYLKDTYGPTLGKGYDHQFIVSNLKIGRYPFVGTHGSHSIWL